MATIGLRDIHYAKMTSEGVYDTPKKLAKAISVELDIETNEAFLYADDALDEYAKEFKQGNITLNINDLSKEVIADLLGQEAGDDGVIYANSEDNAPYVAIGFRAKKPNGEYRYIWLYKTKFGVPKESYQTKGDSLDFKTPEISGAFGTLENGMWKADYTGKPETPVASAWFTKVKTKEA